jgi:hypothetical protein
MKEKRILLALVLLVTIADGAAVASDIPGNPMQLAMGTLPGYPADGLSKSRFFNVQSNYRDRCVMNCKVSYNICREGRGRNNSICVQELNECLPGC